MQETTIRGIMAMDQLMTIKDLELIIPELTEKGMDHLCIPPMMVRHARQLVSDRGLFISTMIGYPFGYTAIESKLAETVLALVDGADEIILCVNIMAIRNNDWQYVARELGTLMPVIRNKGKKLVISTETAWLTDDDIRKCSDLYGVAGVDGILAGSGFVVGNQVENIILYRRCLAEAIPLMITLEPQEDTLRWKEAGIATMFVKMGQSFTVASSAIAKGMVFDSVHKN